MNMERLPQAYEADAEMRCGEEAGVLGYSLTGGAEGGRREPAAHIDAGSGDGALRHGRYSGGDRFADLDLRVDLELGVVSGDLFRRDQGQRTWVASFRTVKGDTPATGRPLKIMGEDRHGKAALGRLSLSAGAGSLTAALQFESPLDGLPFNREFGFFVDFEGAQMRRLGIEFEIEYGVEPPQPATIDGVEYTFASVMTEAGFEVRQTGSLSVLPPALDNGWSEKELEAAMHHFAQSDTGQPGFDLRMLWISRTNRAGVLGVMFDIKGEMQRQGFAVCDTVLRNREDIPDARRPAKSLQTAVHEAGHALNLAHRFEREVGRADSLSPMSYDWKYKGGGHAESFWRDFRFKFDLDELRFLRHGAFGDVAPGGSAFHSVRYWADGDGGYAPYVPQFPLPGWKLELLLPDDPVYMFGQPVVVGVKLTNLTGRKFIVPKFLLDQKSGFLEITIEREGGKPQHFHPLVHRCCDLAQESTLMQLPHGEAMVDNASLVFGSSGFPFAEPGNYRIRAVLSLGGENGETDFQRVTFSNDVRIRVSAPHSRAEERHAYDLFDPRAGQYLALGGTDRLENFEPVLLKIADERSGISGGDVLDPVAAHIHRSMGFNANRPFLRFRDGGFRRREADRERAAEHFKHLDETALRCLDSVTRQKTLNFKKTAFADRT